MSVDRVSQCGPSTTIKYDPSSYKVVFFSSAPIGIPFMDKLNDDKRFDLVGAVTMPDAQSGRWMKLQANVIKTHALKLWIDENNIQTPRSLKLDSKKFSNDAENCHYRLRNIEPDFVVVIAYGKVIPEEMLSIPYFGSINVHGSILPHYRGASPLQTIFLENQAKTWITIMLMSKNVDEGDILTTKEIKIPLERTAVDLIEKMKNDGPKLLVDTLRNYGKGHIDPKPQDHTQATYSNKIEKHHGTVDPFKDSLQSIYNKRRAYILWPKTSFIHDGKQILIEKIVLNSSLYEANNNNPLLSWSFELNTAVLDLQVKPEDKKTISWEDFKRWYVK